MELNEFGSALNEIEQQSAIYIYADPVVPDFTTGKGFDLHVFGNGISASTEVTPKNCSDIASMMGLTLFNANKTRTFLTYDIKSTLTYFRHCMVGNQFNFPSNFIDIQIVEKFNGKDDKAPKTFVDAMLRFKELMKDKGWLNLFRKLYIPLALHTLPAMERTALLDTGDRIAKYGHYEIEGQTNGRLRSYKAYERSFLPHTLDADHKALLKPRGIRESFLYFDIKNCEVTVMAWLSNDQYLYEITHADKDVYAVIYKDITGDDCNTEKKREMAKMMFLSVMYGSGSKTLSEKLNINLKVGEELVARIHGKFKTTSAFMRSVQEQAKAGPVTDRFGRRREYESPYVARNAITQAAAAMACLEKLNTIHQMLKDTSGRLCLSVHDGYCVVCPTQAVRDNYIKVKSAFDVESELCSGLRFKVGYSFGDTLGTLQPLGH